MPQRYLFLFLFLQTATRGQSGGTGGVALRGEIENDGPAKLGEKYAVMVSECGGDQNTARSTIAFDNKFEFRDLKAGCKVVRILSSDERQVLHEERVLAEGDIAPVMIHLEDRRTGAVNPVASSTSPTVSVDTLRNPIPPKAMRALADASRLTQGGRMEEAAVKLRSIVEHYPKVWQAHLNLGVIEMKLGHPVEALASFLRTRELEPRSSKAALDSAIALIVLRRVPEAERAAREALKLDPTNQNAHMLLDRIRIGRERGYVRSGPEKSGPE